MPHPFFDVPFFPWKRDDAIAFYDAVWNAIREAARIDVIYRQAGGTRPLNQAAADIMWREVINYCVAAGVLKATGEASP